MRVVLFCILMLAAFVRPAVALETEAYSDRTLLDNIEKFVDTPQGALNWQVLGATKEILHAETDKEGYVNEWVSAKFPDAVIKLDGQSVTIKGFMFPLAESDKQPVFLFGPFPVSCPFHYHVGPNLVIEAHADKKPVEFSYDPITLRGVLELVRNDPDSGMFFRLKNAEQVQ